jgi:pyruvate/2-oxoglutarate/acetoin dehydrogenase E1 component
MLLSFDQIINNAAKMHFMYGGNLQSNVTIRAIVGKGWGQGPTHSQNFQAMLGSVPGLKVYFPFNSNDIFNILYHSIFDPNPVVIIEHRWLYELESKIKEQKKIKFLEKISSGNNGTIVCMGNTVLDAHILKKIFHQKKITFDIIKILSINPLKVDMVINSVKKTKNLILLEPSNKSMSVSSEILARVHTSGIFFKSKIISNEEMPIPTSFYLADKAYPQIKKSVKIICNFYRSNQNLIQINIPKNYMMCRIRILKALFNGLDL